MVLHMAPPDLEAMEARLKRSEREAGGHEEADRMWRPLPVVQKPWLACHGKRFRERCPLGPLEAAQQHAGAAQGPG